jgi:prepilin signal peptidase PulO-like enzyme (type II secretory pathway)
MNFIEISSSFIFGSLWGSFFYSLALRYVNGSIKDNLRKALTGRSRCPDCGIKIKPLFLIPILGYILSRGKCDNCGSRISPEYPAAEIIFGLLMILTVNSFGISFYAMDIFLLLSAALTLSYVDIKTFTIPNSLVILFTLLSIYPVILNSSYKDNLFGFLLMFSFFILILIFFPGSFGGGDLKFASVVGFFSGLEFSIVALEAALISGALFGVLYALVTKKGFKTKIPFGPFISLGLFISIFFGRDILLIYFKLN